MISDKHERQRALETQASFIVQAPAGSGKTELLTRRYLALLAKVDNPEEIVAITFTKKAAMEMRNRIVQSLINSKLALVETMSDFELEGHELSMAALDRDALLNWRLLDNPSRLRVQTIDSFCSSIVRQMPVLSEVGVVPQISDDADNLYNRAIEEMLTQFLNQENNNATTEALDCLLEFLDNKVPKLQHLLVEMLATRDQWNRHLPHSDNLQQLKLQLEGVLSSLIQERLDVLRSYAPVDFETPLFDAMKFAEEYFRAADPEANFDSHESMQEWPDVSWESLNEWKKIAGFVTTKSTGSTKKRLTKKDGFPAGSKADAELTGLSILEIKSAKKQFQDRLDKLGQNGQFVSALNAIKQLPENGYSLQQWRLMESLIQVLKIVSAYLNIIFSETGQSDYTEIALGADRALGNDLSPTELALRLDYQIRHLLIDEFQDTSLLQFALFEKLTSGWQLGDGHTFFAVGDPMQSIYRFREAQVGLFIKAKQQGISSIKLIPLTLSVNFRSTENLVEWVNDTFSSIFPATDNMHLGEVSYSSSNAFIPISVASNVSPHFLHNQDRESEAEKVASICAETLENYPHDTVAILIRTKSQAGPIVEALKKLNISYAAVDIDRLCERTVVKDILSLLRAMLHPADRIHWLALLRAPWCGISLVDIYTLLDGESVTPIWDLINEPDRVNKLLPESQERLEYLTSTLHTFMDIGHRGDITQWLEYIWYQLGGHVCLENESDLEAAEVCFAAIREFEINNSLFDLEKLNKNLQELYAPVVQEPQVLVQIMTIHKSKGLEFGTVILPGLDKVSSRDRKKLLNWVELPGKSEKSDLLLAPIDEAGEKEPILNVVTETEKTKASNELLRLLYVACTRAKYRLHLCALIGFNNQGERKKPASGSLLDALSPKIQEWIDDVKQTESLQPPIKTNEKPSGLRLKMLPLHWQHQLTALPVSDFDNLEISETHSEQSLDFLWASDVARQIGSVVHRQLQRIGDTGLDQWNNDRVEQSRWHYNRLLTAEGVSDVDLESACDRVVKAIISTINDTRGKWILDAEQKEAKCEYALTGVVDGRINNIIIDRTFVDDQNVRWIIDYKTGIHEGTEEKIFFENELQRYRPQLERYALMMSHIEDRAIKLGLYYPLMHKWIEWTPDANAI